ncbi:kelch-like protein 8 [Hermetia illucens]|nr:kelch-like protein 8 [Hermetia illucens]
MGWVHHDPNERKQHMGNLLELIKTAFISSSFLNTTILKENLLREDIGGAKWLLANFSLQQSYNPFLREPIELYPDAEQPNFVIMDRTNRCLGFNTETKQLFNLANHPRAQGYCAVSYKEDVYLFGGKRTRTALRYSVGTNNWETIPFRCYFTMHSGVVANDSAYFTGGYSCFHRVWQNLVCRYDFHLAKMTQGSTMLMRRASHGSVVCDDCLYVCGGSNRTVDSIMELALSERMDIREGMWRLLPHMKSTHGDCSSAVVNGNVYCSDTFGGKTERFDVRRYNWETVATAPGAMGSIVTHNEKLYRVHQSGIAVYDELEDSWSKVIEYDFDTPTVAVTNI